MEDTIIFYLFIVSIMYCYTYMHTIFRSIQQVHDTHTHTLTAVILDSKYLARGHSRILITETYCPTDLAQHKPLEIINNKYWLLSYCHICGLYHSSLLLQRNGISITNNTQVL